ncbi:MAG: CBS domain-containing protein [Nitrososphaerales archaeon]
MSKIFSLESKLSELHLETAYLVSKAQKIPMVIEVMRRYDVDRVIVVSDSKLVGVVTVKDIFSKISSKRMSRLSPTSLTVAAFTSPNIITAHPEDTALQAAERLLEYNIAALPVVGNDGVVRGLVTKLLLVPLMVKSSMRCRDFMQPPFVAVGLRSKLSTALEKLSNTPIRELVVVEGDKPVGIISEREAAFTLFNLLRVEQIRHFDTFIKRLLVLDAMRRLTAALSGEESVKEAAKVMRSIRVNTLPIVKNDKIVGLVNRDNIFERLLKLEAEERGGKV